MFHLLKEIKPWCKPYIEDLFLPANGTKIARCFNHQVSSQHKNPMVHDWSFPPKCPGTWARLVRQYLLPSSISSPQAQDMMVIVTFAWHTLATPSSDITCSNKQKQQTSDSTSRSQIAQSFWKKIALWPKKFIQFPQDISSPSCHPWSPVPRVTGLVPQCYDFEASPTNNLRPESQGTAAPFKLSRYDIHTYTCIYVPIHNVTCTCWTAGQEPI